MTVQLFNWKPKTGLGENIALSIIAIIMVALILTNIIFYIANIWAGIIFTIALFSH